MTKPSRLQEQACERLAEALRLAVEGARLDGRGMFGPADLDELVKTLARASSAFDAEQIIARALEGRGRSLGLRSGTGELLTLMDGQTRPLEMLLLADPDFRERVAAAEAELGGI